MDTKGFGTIIQELLEGAPNSVPHVASLSDVSTAQTKLVYVESVRDFFVKRVSNRPVDGIEVLDGGWERLNISHPSWSLEPEFYIDPVDGSDENPGTSNAEPIKTFAELIRRLGREYTPRTHQVVYVLNDCPEEVSWSINICRHYLVIQGVTQVLNSGAVSGNVNVNAATNTLAQASFPFTPSETSLLYNQNNVSWSWVIDSNGSGGYYLSKWRGTSLDTAPSTALQQRNAANGHIVQELKLVEFSGSWSIHVRSPNPTNGPGFFSINYIRFTATNTITVLGCMFMQRCCIYAEPLVAGGALRLENCLIENGPGPGTILTGFDTHSSVTLQYGLCKKSLFINDGGGGAGDLRLTHVITWGSRIRVDTGRLYVIEPGVFNSTADAIEVRFKGVLRHAGGTLWGSGSVGAGLQIRKGGRAWVTGTTHSLTGDLGQIAFDGRTTSFATDPDTGLPIAPQRGLTWSNLAENVSSGGFGGTVIDPITFAFITTS